MHSIFVSMSRVRRFCCEPFYFSPGCFLYFYFSALVFKTYKIRYSPTDILFLYSCLIPLVYGPFWSVSFLSSTIYEFIMKQGSLQYYPALIFLLILLVDHSCFSCGSTSTLQVAEISTEGGSTSWESSHTHTHTQNNRVALSN